MSSFTKYNPINAGHPFSFTSDPKADWELITDDDHDEAGLEIQEMVEATRRDLKQAKENL